MNLGSLLHDFLTIEQCNYDYKMLTVLLPTVHTPQYTQTLQAHTHTHTTHTTHTHTHAHTHTQIT